MADLQREARFVGLRLELQRGTDGACHEDCPVTSNQPPYPMLNPQSSRRSCILREEQHRRYHYAPCILVY